MTTPQKLPASGASKVNNEDAMENFPAGLRVLVVDDDMTCLRVLEQMLRRCLYQAVTCTRATIALSLLRERRGSFDIVISDVHMPDMDGFKLLEHVGLEMDLPVIMMSADGSTSAVMRGIKHGACDYLIKPVRIEELKNIWQHVVRKKFNENKENENSGSVEDNDRNKRGGDDAENASSVNDATDGSWKSQKKKREAKEDEDDGELENDDPSASKKPRVVWSVELHQQFVSAVNQLGIDKAVPKRILELMNVPGLTRENVASHLQKFRLYLKRLSGVTQHHSPYGSVETNPKVNPLGGLDLQALAASSQIPPQALAAALQAELLGRPSGSMVLPVTDQASLFQTSVPGPKYTPLEHGLGFGQPLVKCQTNMAKQFQQNKVILEDSSSGFSDWSASNVTACSTGNISGLSNLQNSNMLAHILPQKCSQPTLPEAGHPVSMHPSCLVVPSQPSTAYQVGSNSNLINSSFLTVPAQQPNPYQVGHNLYPVNQNSGFGNGGTILDYGRLSSQRGDGSFCLGQSDGQLKGAGPLNGGSQINGFLVSGPISSPFSSGLASVDGSNGWRVSSSPSSIPTLNASRLSTPYLSDLQGSTSGVGLPDPMQATSFGFVGKGASIPSRFAIYDVDSSADHVSQRITIGNDAGRVKQEVQLDFMEVSKGGNTVLPHFSTSDYMSVISK